ncbi:hypothetical protein KY285_030070 [Solanum tuberosum]|nr:hypothetical protein KY285_030070 [Solanum tuberosum]
MIASTKQTSGVGTKIPSWVVRKVLESRDQLINRLGSHGTIQQQLVKAQLGDRFSIRKIVTKKIWNCMLQWLGHRRQIQDWETEVNWMSQIARRRGGVAEITSCVFAMVVKVMLMPMPKMGRYLVVQQVQRKLNSIPYYL